MALTAAQTQTVYHACGLRAEGGSYNLIRFTPYTQTDIGSSSTTWDYSSVKTAIDTNLAALSDAANTWLGSAITNYDSTLLSSFQMTGEVKLSDPQEFELARNVIRDVVGVHVAPVDAIESARSDEGQARQGRVTR